MRRALSILLVLFFGFGPLAATFQAEDDARLPACCRTHGAHHCAMSAALRGWMLRAESETPAFTAPAQCPLYPGFLSQATSPIHALAAAGADCSAANTLVCVATLYRSALHTSPRNASAVRGPPSSALA
jgi:hypothetical protein